LPAEVKGALKSGDAAKTVTIPKRTKPMKIIDDNVTVIAPEGVVFLEKQEDTFEALKCRKCDE